MAAEQGVKSLSAVEQRVADVITAYLIAQEEDVLARANSNELQAALRAGSPILSSMLMSRTIERHRLNEALTAILTEIAKEAAQGELSDAEIEAIVEEQLNNLDHTNATTADLIGGAIVTALTSPVGDNDSDSNRSILKTVLLLALIRSVFRSRRRKAEAAAANAVVSTTNTAAFEAAVRSGKTHKTWVSQRDGRVRREHIDLDDETVLIHEPFFVDGIPIRFPHDPVAPPHLIIGCRCYLRFSRKSPE